MTHIHVFIAQIVERNSSNFLIWVIIRGNVKVNFCYENSDFSDFYSTQLIVCLPFLAF